MKEKEIEKEFEKLEENLCLICDEGRQYLCEEEGWKKQKGCIFKVGLKTLKEKAVE